MARQTRFPNSIVDKYLREASGLRLATITDVITDCASKLDVHVSTIQRWRSDDSLSNAEHILNIIILINKNRPDGQKCNLKDVAILCNYRNMYRDKKETQE